MEDELVLLNLKWKWLENLCDDECGGGGGGDGDVGDGGGGGDGDVGDGGGGGDGDVGDGGGGVMVAEWRMNWYC